MSNSKLATIHIPAKYYSKGRDGRKLSMITIHHMAGVMTAKQCGQVFQNRQASAHYGIGNDGKIGQYVDEKDTAWANGDWDSNCKAVTIETSNNKTGGKWTVGNKALKSLIKLVADIAKRNNLGTLVKGKNVTWHRMYMATTCPGDYLLSKMDYIVAEANKLNKKEEKKNDVGRNTVGQTKKFKKTPTYIYKNADLKGEPYTYLKNTKVVILKNVSKKVDYIQTVDYIKEIKGKRKGYVKINVYK